MWPNSHVNHSKRWFRFFFQPLSTDNTNMGKYILKFCRLLYSYCRVVLHIHLLICIQAFQFMILKFHTYNFVKQLNKSNITAVCKLYIYIMFTKGNAETWHIPCTQWLYKVEKEILVVSFTNLTQLLLWLGLISNLNLTELNNTRPAPSCGPSYCRSEGWWYRYHARGHGSAKNIISQTALGYISVV